VKVVDRILQRWRERVARGWIRPGDRVLDIGCHQGEFLDRLGQGIGPSVGFDPLARPRADDRVHLRAEPFTRPSGLPDGGFEAAVMLAVLEHVTDKEPLAAELFRVLAPGGRAIITVPSPRVDAIIHTLVRFQLADGMSLDEHHGFRPDDVPALFARHGFELERHRPFQLGLNHLFVFRKPAGSVNPPADSRGTGQ
jgi:SAM-dependent methyltransferase